MLPVRLLVDRHQLLFRVAHQPGAATRLGSPQGIEEGLANIARQGLRLGECPGDLQLHPCGAGLLVSAVKVSERLPQQPLGVGERPATTLDDALNPAQSHQSLMVGGLAEEGFRLLRMLDSRLQLVLGKMEQRTVAVSIAQPDLILPRLVCSDTRVEPLGGTSPVPPRRAATAGSDLALSQPQRDPPEVVEAPSTAALVPGPLRQFKRRLERLAGAVEVVPVEIECSQATGAVGNRAVVAEALLAQPGLLEELAGRLDVVLPRVEQAERVEHLAGEEVVAPARVQRVQQVRQGVTELALGVVVEAALVGDAGAEDVVARVAGSSRLGE